MRKVGDIEIKTAQLGAIKISFEGVDNPSAFKKDDSEPIEIKGLLRQYALSCSYGGAGLHSKHKKVTKVEVTDTFFVQKESFIF